VDFQQFQSNIFWFGVSGKFGFRNPAGENVTITYEIEAQLLTLQKGDQKFAANFHFSVSESRKAL
jgi:hypothetical protein